MHDQPIDHLFKPVGTARPEDAQIIAMLILSAYGEEACRFFLNGKSDMQRLASILAGLVRREDSLYSYRNCLVIRSLSDELAAVAICYDGGDYHRLRQSFDNEVLELFGHDVTQMPDEAEPGELYLDTIAVAEPFRRNGLASTLLGHVVDKARSLSLPRVTLLVDSDNDRAASLYRRYGFVAAGDRLWAGKPMELMMLSIDQLRGETDKCS